MQTLSVIQLQNVYVHYQNSVNEDSIIPGGSSVATAEPTYGLAYYSNVDNSFILVCIHSRKATKES